MSEVAIVTRPVARSEPHNWLGRAVEEGERFTVFHRPTYGSVDTQHGIALTEKDDGGYPFFEFPLDAVRIVVGETFCSNCGPLDSPGVHTQPDCPRFVAEAST